MWCVRVLVCARARARVCVYVCVCVEREREREREREGHLTAQRSKGTEHLLRSRIWDRLCPLLGLLLCIIMVFILYVVI